MRTENSIRIENEESPDLSNKIAAMICVFTRKALESAELYVSHHPGRMYISPTDIDLALKNEVFCFSERENIDEEIMRAEQLFNEESVQSEESSDVQSQNSEDGGISDISTTASQTSFDFVEEYSMNTCNCDLCVKMNNIEHKWSEWVPETKVEKILYSSISKANSLI